MRIAASCLHLQGEFLQGSVTAMMPSAAWCSAWTFNSSATVDDVRPVLDALLADYRNTLNSSTAAVSSLGVARPTSDGLLTTVSESWCSVLPQFGCNPSNASQISMHLQACPSILLMSAVKS
jgi:hypothetical protein